VGCINKVTVSSVPDCRRRPWRERQRRAPPTPVNRACEQ